MTMPRVFDRLVSALARLPGVGRRSAARMAFRLVARRDSLLPELAQALADAAASLRCCSLCGGVTAVEDDPCRLCADPARDTGVLCVVEDPSDIEALEKSGAYRGRYHALMGKLSPQQGTGPGQLRLEALVRRVREGGVAELVLALNTDVESDATAAFVRECVEGLPVRVSRLGTGLPMGSGVAYADSETLARALAGRQPLARPGTGG
jgi:recombination protein RecR